VADFRAPFIRAKPKRALLTCESPHYSFYAIRTLHRLTAHEPQRDGEDLDVFGLRFFSDLFQKNHRKRASSRNLGSIPCQPHLDSNPTELCHATTLPFTADVSSFRAPGPGENKTASRYITDAIDSSSHTKLTGRQILRPRAQDRPEGRAQRVPRPFKKTGCEWAGRLK